MGYLSVGVDMFKRLMVRVTEEIIVSKITTSKVRACVNAEIVRSMITIWRNTGRCGPRDGPMYVDT